MYSEPQYQLFVIVSREAVKQSHKRFVTCLPAMTEFLCSTTADDVLEDIATDASHTFLLTPRLAK